MAYKDKFELLEELLNSDTSFKNLPLCDIIKEVNRIYKERIKQECDNFKGLNISEDFIKLFVEEDNDE